MAVVSISNLAEAGNNHRLDAEFYQPEYFIDFSKGDWKPLRGFLDICQYGISQAMTEEPIGHPIFRMNDIKGCFLLDDEVKYIEISDRVFQQFKLQTNDILFNRVNAEEFVGRTGIFKLQGDYVFASYLIRLRVKPNAGLLADYLNIFLNTKYGKKQIRRFSRRAVNQANVNAEELQGFRIAMLPLSIQTQISQLSTDAWKQVELSRSLYRNAENLLLEKLGLKGFKPNYELSYRASLSKAFGVHRVDAEYFQPKYEALIDSIKQFQVAKLGQLARRTVTKLKPEDDVQYKYIEISDVETGIGEINYTERLGKELPPNARIPINGGELIISKVRPTRGAISIVPIELNQKVICSSAFSVFRAESPLKEYLYITTRSMVGKLQMERPTTGTSYPTIRDDDVEDIQVPIVSKEVQQRISSLVLQSHGAKKKAKQLLEEAKSKIENLIEDEA